MAKYLSQFNGDDSVLWSRGTQVSHSRSGRGSQGIYNFERGKSVKLREALGGLGYNAYLYLNKKVNFMKKCDFGMEMVV